MSHIKRAATASVAALTLALCQVPALAAEGSTDIDPYGIGAPTDLPDLPQDVRVPATEGSTDIGLTGTLLSKPYEHAPGAIRNEFGTAGPHQATFTNPVKKCADLYYSVYALVTHYTQGTTDPLTCSGTFPSGPESPAGYQFVYPSDIAKSQEKAPLIVLSPGIGAEPGNLAEQASFYASHGYVVALGYSFVNWFGQQVEAAAIGAMEANRDPNSPLFERIDASQTILVGHSAGGGSVIRVTETLPGTVAQATGDNSFQVGGVVGVSPGPADFGTTTPAPTKPLLILAAQNESLVPHPLSRLLYDRAEGPKWWAVIEGAFHGTYYNPAQSTVYGPSIMAFAEYVRTHSPRSQAVFEGDGLAQDSELLRVERG